MKKVKIAFWIIVFGFIGLVIFQNRGFFMTPSSLLVDLGFFRYVTPMLANAVFFVAFFLLGTLISYIFGLFRHFKDAKTIKSLKAKETSLVDTVASLEKQLATATAPASVASDPADLPKEEQPVEVVAEVK